MTVREIVACVVAPLVVPVTVAAASWTWRAVASPGQQPPTIFGLGLAWIFGVVTPLAYSAMVVLGLPALALLERHRRQSILALCLVGAGIGGLVSTMFGWVLFTTWSVSLLITGLVLGAEVGGAYALIRGREQQAGVR